MLQFLFVTYEHGRSRYTFIAHFYLQLGIIECAELNRQQGVPLHAATCNSEGSEITAHVLSSIREENAPSRLPRFIYDSVVKIRKINGARRAFYRGALYQRYREGEHKHPRRGARAAAADGD